MFDEVLLAPEIAKAFGIPDHLSRFQTVDLTNEGDIFTITADGRLVVAVDTSVGIRRTPFPYAHRSGDDLVDTCHHGEITFYTNDNRTTGWWYEYEAQFVTGNLKSIVRRGR